MQVLNLEQTQVVSGGLGAGTIAGGVTGAVIGMGIPLFFVVLGGGTPIRSADMFSFAKIIGGLGLFGATAGAVVDSVDSVVG